MRRSLCFPARHSSSVTPAALNEDGCWLQRTHSSEFSTGRNKDKGRGVMESLSLKTGLDCGAVHIFQSGGFMDCSRPQHSLCRLSAQTAGRSKWSLAATDLPASICTGDQSFFFFFLNYHFPHSLSLFSHRPRLVSLARSKLWMAAVELPHWEGETQLVVSLLGRVDKLDYNRES